MIKEIKINDLYQEGDNWAEVGNDILYGYFSEICGNMNLKIGDVIRFDLIYYENIKYLVIIKDFTNEEFKAEII